MYLDVKIHIVSQTLKNIPYSFQEFISNALLCETIRKPSAAQLGRACSGQPKPTRTNILMHVWIWVNYHDYIRVDKTNEVHYIFEVQYT